MLDIIIPDQEFWDDKRQVFIDIKGAKFTLEHSLVSIAKWESKWKKPFFSEKQKTELEFIDYIKCMTITQNVNPVIYLYLPDKEKKKIQNYVNDSFTATTFPKTDKKATSTEVLTSEVIYYYMFTVGIDKECEKWNITRLLTLLKVFSVKNNEKSEKNKATKKPSTPNMAKRASINAARRQRMGSSG